MATFFLPSDASYIYAEYVAIFTFLAAIALLIILVVIDFKKRLLPNKYVFPYAALGLIFHFLTQFTILPFSTLLVGGALGYCLLWLIRALGSWYYKQEALGLGDVKLMGAAGLWLGPEYLMMALTLGASLSIVHGLAYAVISKQSLRRLEIPAGPGLIGGIIILTGWMVWQKEWLIFAG